MNKEGMEEYENYEPSQSDIEKDLDFDINIIRGRIRSIKTTLIEERLMINESVVEEEPEEDIVELNSKTSKNELQTENLKIEDFEKRKPCEYKGEYPQPSFIGRIKIIFTPFKYTYHNNEVCHNSH